MLMGAVHAGLVAARNRFQSPSSYVMLFGVKVKTRDLSVAQFLLFFTPTMFNQSCLYIITCRDTLDVKYTDL